jgi:hypothetical protein
VLPLTLSALTILLLLFSEPAAAALDQWTGARSSGTGTRAAAINALTLLLAVALILALNPEVRLFLIFLDALGVDIFLMLLFFQGRDILQWLHAAVGLPTARSLERWGWYPMTLPHRSLFKQHPWWGLYATLQPIAIALIVAGTVFFVTWPLIHALRIAL